MTLSSIAYVAPVAALAIAAAWTPRGKAAGRSFGN